jgi:hypothetical protein
MFERLFEQFDHDFSVNEGTLPSLQRRLKSKYGPATDKQFFEFSVYPGEGHVVKFWLLNDGTFIHVRDAHAVTLPGIDSWCDVFDEGSIRVSSEPEGTLSLDFRVDREDLTEDQLWALVSLANLHDSKKVTFEDMDSGDSTSDISSGNDLMSLIQGKSIRKPSLAAQFHENVDEATASAIKRKQKSINKLFPQFPERVKAVQDKGGLRLKKMDQDTWHWKIHSGTKSDVWYDAVVYFKGVEQLLRKLVADRRLWNKARTKVNLNKLSREFMKRADIQIQCSCLVGDTKIPLLDGRVRTMEELLEEYGTDRCFWVYASDENGDFVPAQAVCLGKTKEVDQLIEVELDNGERVQCTPDHLFRLRDGSYKLAGELRGGESLMPLYLSDSKPNKKFSQSYRRVQLNSKMDSMGRPIRKMVHRVVAETILGDDFSNKKDLNGEYLVVHHKDMNSKNNCPENLEWLGHLEHWKLHSVSDHTNAIRGLKEAWKDEEWAKKARESNRRAGRVSYEKYPENIDKGRQLGIDFMRSDDGRSMMSDRARDQWNDSEVCEKMIQGLKESYADGKRDDHRKAASERMKKYWTPERRQKQRERMSKMNQTLERDLCGGNNHKVVSVRVINANNPIPVYDLSVDGYENFALDAGVFVHNCPAAKYWGSDYILSKPKYDAKYGDKETRPPNVRNPKQYGAMCKHETNLLKALPFYADTVARWLDEFYPELIGEVETEAGAEAEKFKKAGEELRKRKVAKEEPRRKPERPAKEEPRKEPERGPEREEEPRKEEEPEREEEPRKEEKPEREEEPRKEVKRPAKAQEPEEEDLPDQAEEPEEPEEPQKEEELPDQAEEPEEDEDEDEKDNRKIWTV